MITPNWWIKLCLSTGAENWLDADPLAWFAETNVTKVGAVMFTACERLTAYYCASVFPKRIACSAKFSVSSATYFGALVFFTRLQLITNSVALEIVDFSYLLLSQKALSL